VDKLFDKFLATALLVWLGFILGGIAVVLWLLPDLIRAETHLARTQVLATFCSYNENDEVCDD